MFANISGSFSSYWYNIQRPQMGMWSCDKAKEPLQDKTEVRAHSFSNILIRKKLNFAFGVLMKERLVTSWQFIRSDNVYWLTKFACGQWHCTHMTTVGPGKTARNTLTFCSVWIWTTWLIIFQGDRSFHKQIKLREWLNPLERCWN